MNQTRVQSRQQRNLARLNLLHVALRPKVAAVLRDLEGHHWQPLIDAAAHRTIEQQRALVAQGRSTVRFSFHNCTSRSGAPESLAADIFDARYGWDSPRLFWLQLAASAEAHGLDSGIYFGLKRTKAALRAAIVAGKWDEAPQRLGWDPAHVQWRGIPLLAARLGKRPKVV